MKVSKNSQTFLENLRVYLVASGKNENEIEETIDELHDHLLEAEQNGKNVEQIIGMSPKEYMESIAHEMKGDVHGWSKYLFLIAIGAATFIVLGDALREGLSYTILELIGYPIIFALFLLAVVKCIKFLASAKLKKGIEWLLYWMIGGIPLGLMLLLLFLNDRWQTPMITFNQTANAITIGVAIAVLIGLSVWARSWVMILVAILLVVPDIILDRLPLEETSRLVSSSIVTSVLIIALFLIALRKEKRENAS
ncbi:HAAS domain-containing protein [Radiobacillus deserti]|uniref:HAAS transmembrane region domain-containing protein n=1 Tax=Radiobacillus deserti TaxID=2594883 RepID=A0A516KES6_9BACI|nr:hypothetical protein [Radiobacillus deserti]QDP39857.1 hypothetical protein FN924_06565 [Radiobacillus deserti]